MVDGRKNKQNILCFFSKSSLEKNLNSLEFSLTTPDGLVKKWLIEIC